MMTISHQKLIVSIVWCLMLISAVHKGISPPFSQPSANAGNVVDAIGFKAFFGLLGPLAILVIHSLRSSLFPQQRNASNDRIIRWIESRWGDGSVHAFLKALRPMALVGSSGIVAGATGLASSIRANASPLAFETSLFFLSAGAGFMLARAIASRMLPNEPWF